MGAAGQDRCEHVIAIRLLSRGECFFDPLKGCLTPPRA